MYAAAAQQMNLPPTYSMNYPLQVQETIYYEQGDGEIFLAWDPQA